LGARIAPAAAAAAVVIAHIVAWGNWRLLLVAVAARWFRIRDVFQVFCV